MQEYGRPSAQPFAETLIQPTQNIYYNISATQLVEEALKRGEGLLSEGGALVVHTGEHTGRSAKDKYIVHDAITAESVWWGDVNQPLTPEHAECLFQDVVAHLGAQELFVQDCRAGADTDFGINIRVVSPSAWHTLFAQNMFIRLNAAEYRAFMADYTLYHAPEFFADISKHGTRSGTFIVLDFTAKRILIGGTSYAGEIKKAVFTVLNYLLPEQNVLPMHCSANIGEGNKSAVFFGLSGTGKTTLSADSRRTLIGDDEHGWGDSSLFNFEGGCYAKTIRLNPEAEPEIYATTRMFGTVLENVVVNSATRVLDLDDASLTENTRACYPLEYIPNASKRGSGPVPQNIIMLTADAFGVLPPISRLDTEQALYHFLSGYTAKIAGTEKGLGNEPVATFSTCFGAPFMPRHPVEYAALLAEKLEESGATCWLINTGWTGGAYGTGSRMNIAYTRAMVEAALSGALENVSYATHSIFDLQMPTSCPGVPAQVLDPRATWADKAAYDAAAKHLQGLFEANFKQYEERFLMLVKPLGQRAA